MHGRCDIGTDDLEKLLREVEQQAILRTHGVIACADIMSKDVIKVGLADSLEKARSLLLEYNVRVVPVIDDQGHLAGTIGLREIAGASGDVQSRMSPAVIASAETPAVALIPTLTDGQTHAVIMVDESKAILGIVTQTDLLAALAKRLPVAA